MEQNLSPAARLRCQRAYSIPMQDGRRIALLLKIPIPASSSTRSQRDFHFKEKEYETKKLVSQRAREKFNEEQQRKISMRRVGPIK
jgi:hypothetical protein